MDAQLPTRERLILAGISEIENSGIQGFSIRRVATRCGVSCAAPYKHFADKREFIIAIITYINQIWTERQKVAAGRYSGDTRRQLVAISMEYVRFLLENPNFRSIIMLSDTGMDPEQVRLKAEMSLGAKRLIHQYCTEVGMPPETETRKTFVVRSLIYGAALMLENGELENSEESFQFIAAAIDREFDLD